MTVKDVVECIDKAAPYKLACSWDNSGFLIGHGGCEVKRVMIALDFTDNVLTEALECGCNLIVTHHPYIFKGMSRINDETAEGRLVLKLIEGKISLACAHTNLDMAVGGINDVLCEMLGLKNIAHLGFAAEGENGSKIGEFRMGETDEDLCCFIKKVKKTLGCDVVKCNNSENKKLKKVAVCSGSGCSFIDEAVKSGADAYLTSDAKYHDFQLAENSGLILIDAGHFETENIICKKLAGLVNQHGVETVISNKHKGFYKYI